jgi:hypothetical protein
VSAASCTPTVGLVANPLAGTDIRRLVASAAPTTDMAKVGAIRRAVIGAIEGGARRLVMTDDRRSLRRALDRLERDIDPAVLATIDVHLLERNDHDARANTVRAAAAMRDAGVHVVVVLGGDGTNRDVVTGWRDVVLVPVSTGTNNVFPRHVDTTLAGHAAAVVAAGAVPLARASRRAKVIDVTVERRGAPAERDLALVDVALLDGAFTGSRAVWHGDALREIVTTIAEPASIGLSAIAAAVAPCDRFEPFGAHVTLTRGAPRTMRAPIAPGRYVDLAVSSARTIGVGEQVVLAGPGTLSFDGERDVVLGPHDRATLTLAADGPHVIDVGVTLAAAMAARRLAPQSEPDAHAPNPPHSEDH